MIMLKKGMVEIMKKYIYTLVVLLLCIIGADSQKVKAYSVTVEKDGIYAEVVPDSFVNNTAAIFKKHVKKAMKYYNEYKDADDYTYVSKVPDEYRNFIPVAKQIQDSDEIIIRNPFYIYSPYGDEGVYEYFWFFAEKNGKKLCLFEIHIDSGSGKISVEYDKMEDSHFAYDEKTIGETLFYEMDEAIYAETPDKTDVVWDRKLAGGGGQKMLGGNGTDWEAESEAVYQKFKMKSYSEKKDEILAYLAGTKKGKVYKKVEKNLKHELGDEYIEPEDDEDESSRTGIYIVISIGIVVIGVIIGGIILVKKRKED